MQLAEESAEYKLEQTEKRYSHEKLIKNTLRMFEENEVYPLDIIKLL